VRGVRRRLVEIIEAGGRDLGVMIDRDDAIVGFGADP